jgi:hypothetical protein
MISLFIFSSVYSGYSGQLFGLSKLRYRSSSSQGALQLAAVDCYAGFPIPAARFENLFTPKNLFSGLPRRFRSSQ